MNFFGLFIDLILPPRCPVSGEVVDHPAALAPQVWAGLHFITDPCCAVCGAPFDYAVPGSRGAGGAEGQDGDFAALCAPCHRERPVFRQARSALAYDEGSRELVLGFKHGDRLEAAVAMLPWLLRAGDIFWDKVDVIVPVPLHPLRLIRRRYNQAAVLGHALSKATKIAHVPDALKRTRATPSQGSLSGAQRARNVRRAFAIHPRRKKSVMGARVLLLDDVYTTGATIGECTKALYAAGARDVYVLTLARTVRG